MNMRSGANRVSMTIIFIGLAAVVGLSRWIDSHKPPIDVAVEEEQLYLNGTTVRRLSLGFNGLAADWYWMRSLQYVGGKFLNAQQQIRLDDMSPLNLKLLAPLLDTATTLDPQFLEPYEYAAVVLPAVNVEDAIRIINKGIAANPATWRLYQHLGYVYWQQHDYQKSAEVYAAGGKIPGAPRWMAEMGARMLAEGGSLNAARQMYQHLYDESKDDQVKQMLQRRLLQVDSFEQRDLIRRLLSEYSTRTGRCPASWKDISASLQSFFKLEVSTGAPLDPGGTPYVLVNGGCDVDLDSTSLVPYR
ncbi:MAG: tetratricopeptide repeat protein [Pyrinomonadaceae bacterium]